MNKRLLRLAEMLADEECPEEKGDLDLKAEDMANRLEEAVKAVEDCIEILKELGMDEDQASEKIMSAVEGEVVGKEAIPGGLAAGKSDVDFDPEQIAKGIKVELEHTGDREKAKEIARDHLVENPKYYDYLKEMEEKADREKKE